MALAVESDIDSVAGFVDDASGGGANVFGVGADDGLVERGGFELAATDVMLDDRLCSSARGLASDHGELDGGRTAASPPAGEIESLARVGLGGAEASRGGRVSGES